MKKILLPGGSVPILSWADTIDRESHARLETLAGWERLAGPVAVMPDVHYSQGVSVGTVLATRDCVLPTAIGQDFGCGMCTASFEIDARDFAREDLELLVARIVENVPCGRRVHRKARELLPELKNCPLSTRSLEHSRDFIGARHLGTLGEGNHFIELQRDADNRLYVTVHSGSRGMGGAIFQHHFKIAGGGAQQNVPLPHFEINSVNSQNFLNDLQWALDFASENRRRMFAVVEGIIREHTSLDPGAKVLFDVPHNAITSENAGGEKLFIHRKGAMSLAVGARGIIPGSMGTASYIVEGLGCAEAYSSCSHGAGRKLSRSEAHAKISAKEFLRQMRGVVFPNDPRLTKALIDEAPGAYKDIREVLDQQCDLVKPLSRLTPMAVVKG